MSYHQERLWFIDSFEEGNVYEGKPVYHNLPLVVGFDGPVDARLLEESLRLVVRAHAALRTRIVTEAGEAWQSVEKETALEMEVIDLEESDPAGLLERCLESSSHPFSAAEEPRLRAALVRGRGGESAFVLTVHHILTDRRSMGIIAGELARCYGTLAAGKRPALPPETLPYADYSVWQRGVPGSGWEPLLFDWKWRLRGELPVLTLPEDRPRPAIHTYSAGTLEFSLPPGLGRRLEDLSRSKGTDLPAILLSGLAVTLLLYSGQDELVIGISGAGRPEEAAGSVGPFDNLLPVRIRPGGNGTFRGLLKETDGILAEAQAGGALPFDLLVETLNPAVDMSRTALFDALFEFSRKPEPLSFGDVCAEVHRTNLGLGKYDLNLLLEADRGAYRRDGGLQRRHLRPVDRGRDDGPFRDGARQPRRRPRRLPGGGLPCSLPKSGVSRRKSGTTPPSPSRNTRPSTGSSPSRSRGRPTAPPWSAGIPGSRIASSTSGPTGSPGICGEWG